MIRRRNIGGGGGGRRGSPAGEARVERIKNDAQ